MNKQKIGRILAIVVVTIVSATVFNFIASYLFALTSTNSVAGCNPKLWEDEDGCSSPNFENATIAVTFLGAVFGFWLVYTGRLARMFRKV